MIGLRHNEMSDASELPAIAPLRAADIGHLRLGWSSRFDRDDVERILEEFPGLSFWVPDTAEYVLGGNWRHRREVLGILELAASASAIRLMDALADAASRANFRLVIASEHHETRKRAFYDSARFDLIEEILIYELTRVRLSPPDFDGLRFDLVSLDDEEAMAELVALDHAAFPWLWWNSVAEFDNYGQSPGVEIYLGRNESDTPVSYVGLTRFRSRGHLDRIAVAPEQQGRSFGLRSLEWAVYVLGQRGARRVGLSTQARNTVSRRLYEQYGFRRVPSQDYLLYGRWLSDRRDAT